MNAFFRSLLTSIGTALLAKAATGKDTTPAPNLSVTVDLSSEHPLETLEGQLEQDAIGEVASIAAKDVPLPKL